MSSVPAFNTSSRTPNCLSKFSFLYIVASDCGAGRSAYQGFSPLDVAAAIFAFFSLVCQIVYLEIEVKVELLANNVDIKAE